MSASWVLRECFVSASWLLRSYECFSLMSASLLRVLWLLFHWVLVSASLLCVVLSYECFSLKTCACDCFTSTRLEAWFESNSVTLWTLWLLCEYLVSASFFGRASWVLCDCFVCPSAFHLWLWVLRSYDRGCFSRTIQGAVLGAVCGCFFLMMDACTLWVLWAFF